MATNEPFWLGVPKSNMWPSRDSFQFEDAASQRRKSAAACANICVRATSQAGELEQAQANNWEKSSFLLKLEGRTDTTFCGCWTLWVKVKPCRKHKLSKLTMMFIITAQGNQGQALWWELMGALRLWILISISIGIWDHTAPNWTPFILTRGGQLICHDHILLLRSCSERVV